MPRSDSGQRSFHLEKTLSACTLPVNMHGVAATSLIWPGKIEQQVICLPCQEKAKEAGATAAVLKARSPSCGRGAVYDGTFTHTLIKGNGVTAEALLGAGLAVYTEEDVAAEHLPAKE